MKYPDTKIELASDPKHHTPSLQAPWLDVAAGKLIATNGHILAALPIEASDTDTTGPVPIDALKAARKRDAMPSDGVPSIDLNGAAELPNGARVPRDTESAGAFPDFDRVIPEKPGADPDIIFDADLLKRLSDALHDRSAKDGRVGLYFGKKPDGTIDPMAPIRVEVPAHDERIGVLMPCRR